MRSIRVSKTAFKSRALELFRQLQETGGRVVITDHGKPVVEILPYRGTNDAALDLLRGTVLRYVEHVTPVDVKWDAAE